MSINEKFPGVFLVDGKVATKATFKEWRPFDEAIISGYRLWDPNRSKASAAIAKGISTFPLKRGDKILYLGAAHGFTVSYLSDIIGKEGIIYAVEFSDRCFKELMQITAKYGNIAPILSDARLFENYGWVEKVDAVYCDIADPQQTETAIRNCREFLKKDGYLLLAIKSRSIDVTASPKQTVLSEIDKLKAAGFKVFDWKMLDPFEKDHGFVVAMMK
ncbi:MAG: fibrillarin-like rRNA/tRNA 2'-O-methyltransferase [Candidatus Aenigmatarchaeota archaeon]